jgi:pimeloyl-ACP methyl ester carboxylesterase
MKQKPYLTLTVVSVASSILMVGCNLVLSPLVITSKAVRSPNKAYHTEPQTGENYDFPVQQNPTRQSHLRVVEFDDQGELWSPQQLKNVASDLSKAKDQAMVVFFTHGWNNNADPNTEGKNYQQFQETIKRLGEAYSSRRGAQREIWGVYLGWRGLTFKKGGVYLDYFHRRAAAMNVGGVAFNHALHSLLSIVKKKSSNRAIVVGHSFGALAVENAIAEGIARDIARSSEITPPADLVFLVNEAQNSLTTHKLLNALKLSRTTAGATRPYAGPGLPWIVSIQAVDDGPVGKYLPLGAWIGRNAASLTSTTNAGRLRENYRDPVTGQETGFTASQSQLMRTAPGFLKELHSHGMLIKSEAERRPPLQLEYEDLIRENFNLQQTYDPTEGFSYISCISADNQLFTTQVKPTPYNDTPYFIMQCDKTFISGHNGLFEGGSGARNLIGLMTVCSNLERFIQRGGVVPTKPVSGIPSMVNERQIKLYSAPLGN